MDNMTQAGLAGAEDADMRTDKRADKRKMHHAVNRDEVDDVNEPKVPGGWAWFEGMSFSGFEEDVPKKVAGGILPQHDATGRVPEDVWRDGVWQRVLGQAGGADGAEICAQLRAMTLERALGAHASQQAIWMLEGQRALVLQILRRAGVPVHGR